MAWGRKLGKIAGNASESQELLFFDFLDMPLHDNDGKDGSWLPLFCDTAFND